MSIFSHLRRSRQQAKEHSAKLAEQQKKEQDKIPYKHVPTHAATDAFASAPPSWRDQDRPKIVEQNRRRSAMAASGHHMNMPGIPRVGSSLSHVTYPADYANPMVRAYSYNNVPGYPQERGRDINYSMPDMAYSQPVSLKGKEINHGMNFEAPRVSQPLSQGHSPAASSSGSDSSHDDLEMKSSHRQATGRPMSTTDNAYAHRLHPSHRRTSGSDSSVDRVAMVNSAKNAGMQNLYHRESRPPTSMRAYPSIATASMGSTPSPGTLTPTSGHHAGFSNGASPYGSRHSSNTSLSGYMTTPTQYPTSAPAIPRSSAAQSEATINWLSLQSQGSNMTPTTATAAEPAVMVHTVPTTNYKERRAPKTTRFTELDRIESSVDDLPATAQPTAQPPAPQQEVVNVVNFFPEASFSEDEQPASSSKAKKFAKSGGKLMKKHRWSSSKTAVLAA